MIPCEEWEALPTGAEVTGYIYTAHNDVDLCFDHEATADDIKAALKDVNADNASAVFGTAMALSLICIALAVITVFGRMFTAYEQIWFISIMILAAVISIAFPEEDCNGVNGLVIMALYLADTFLNILCELLISKQSKWNFIVSVFVELTEIAICIVLAYRFATLASTLFFSASLFLKKSESTLIVVRSQPTPTVQTTIGYIKWTKYIKQNAGTKNEALK